LPITALQGDFMKIFSQILGQSQATSMDLADDATIADLRDELDLEAHYVAKINGIDATDEAPLKDYAVVVWSEKVKGAYRFTPAIYDTEIYC
jgi:hypothetical protein